MLTYLKIGAAGIVLAIVAGFFYTYYSRGEKVETLTKEVTQVKVENGDLKDTVDTTVKSGAINDQTTAAVADKKEEVTDVQDKIKADTQAKVEEAKRAPPATPQIDPQVPLSPLTPTELQNRAVSQIRINGLWESYCAAVPKNPKCAAQPQGVPK